MRLVYGPIPPSRVLNPLAAGWTPLREWTPGRLSVIATLAALPIVSAAVMLLLDHRAEMREDFRTRPLAGGMFVAALVLMVPIHELMHALAYGRGVRTPHLILGVWPSRGLCCALYDSPVPRDRVLVMLAAPLVVLSVLPLVCLPWLDDSMRLLVVTFCMFHAGTCGGDLIVFSRFISQIPRMAVVHNYGWQTFWTACPPFYAG